MPQKKHALHTLLAAILIIFSAAIANADVATFELVNVRTDRGGLMAGQFTWTYTPGDFENGVGEFISLDVPHTTHGLEDLIVTIETNQIEISLDGSFHDDGVDVTLVLVDHFSLNGPVVLDLLPGESKYSVGGNGFIDGDFLGGAVAPLAVPEPLLGDCNLDGVVDFLDISPFIAILSAGGFLEEADINLDGVVDFLDIAPFIGILSAD